MLQSLSVRNFILIDELELEFNQGFCVITGETGAGKSILLDAILFCLGSKTSSNIIKDGRDTASVTAIFSCTPAIKNLLEQINIEVDSQLIIKCLQLSHNRKKFLINDQIVVQKTVQQIADYLLELHGQNSHTTLLNPAAHIGILDSYSNLLELRSSIAEYFNKWQIIKQNITTLAQEKTAIEREIDYLTFVVEELITIDVKIGEEENLLTIKRELQNRNKDIQLISDLLKQLEIPEIDQAISKALRLIARNDREIEDFIAISKNLDEAYNNIEEARNKLKLILRGFDISEHNIEQVEDRLYEIRGVARKYGVQCDELPEFFHKSNDKLSELKHKIIDSENLTYEAEEVSRQYHELAKVLSEKRYKSAIKLEELVQAELALLKMEKAVFKVEITKAQNESSTGTDLVRFVASTNPGMPLAPIDKIASGGELSRFMLAIKTVLFDKAALPTIVFDEIDTGIGGVVADSVGERLKKLSKALQVIVITHQPQVAGKADQHILVNKVQSENKTAVSVRTLSKEEQTQELARMISGKAITASSLKAAQELLS